MVETWTQIQVIVCGRKCNDVCKREALFLIPNASFYGVKDGLQQAGPLFFKDGQQAGGSIMTRRM